MWKRVKAGCLLIASLSFLVATGASRAQDKASHDVDNEVFRLGIFTGVLNIDNFGSEWVLGVSGTFQASEDFFLQYNYLRADADFSSFEKSQGSYFSGSDRTFAHYDLSVGYNLFQGEVYPREGITNLSSFHLIGGVGETRFGGEESFTFTLGLGYHIALTRRIIFNTDYRHYLYQSDLVRGKGTTTRSGQFSAGVSYLF